MKLAMFAFLALAPLAHAGSYSTRQIVLPYQSVPIPAAVVLPTFDTSLGTLDSVQVVVDRIYGLFHVGAENLDNQPATITVGSMPHPAEVGYRFRLGGSNSFFGLVRNIIPPVNVALDAFDGQHDCHGSSAIDDLLISHASYGLATDPTSDPAVLAEVGGPWPTCYFLAVPTTSFPSAQSSTGGPFALCYTSLDPLAGTRLHLVYNYH